ncbi:glycosyltransferase family 2 protein [Saccharicrinis aurantiacus]|uniref:glycosyltransferase family 2 protein n=1 Tax=Saccharicrinis aurantiacus TaxID=1849719 RepID=UPI00094F66DB|nr:glycosyltransferase family 2 protein [Saccharicrinis aurantiacus]
MNLHLSVIIPNYNNAQFLKECVSSVYNQTYKNFECIVVDDCSTDNSLEVLTEIKVHYSSLIIHKNTSNKGVSYSRNKGAELAKGDYISFLDADDIWLPSKLENELQQIEKTSSTLIFSPYLWFDKNKTFENIEAKNNKLENVFDFWKDSLISPSGLTIKRDFFLNKLKGFDTSLSGCEDMDLYFRCALYGKEFTSSKIIGVHIRIHEQNTKKNYKKMYEAHIMSLKKWHQLSMEWCISDSIKYKQAITNKLSKSRYYASKLNNSKLQWKTVFLGYKILGYKYFDKSIILPLARLIKKTIDNKYDYIP